MKSFFLYISLLFLAVQLHATEPLKIGVISDIHYLSPQLMDNGYAIDNYMLNSGRMVKYTPALLDSALTFYQNKNTDVLLICGDITKDGERQSHMDFAAKLEKLRNNGTKIFVIPGNHDINMPNPLKYIGNKTFKTDNISPDDFAEIYQNYGYKNAIKRDNATLSYVGVLDENKWLLAIDAAQYKQYTTKSLSGGKIPESTEKWIVEVLDEAKVKGIEVIGMMHWGITEHFMYQSAVMENCLVDDWQRLSTLFADKGLKVLFTGHCHANDITLYISPEKNKLYDIETSALCSYPFAYRLAYYYPDQMSVISFNVPSLPGVPHLAEKSKSYLKTIGKRLAKSKLTSLKLDYPVETQDILTDIAAQIFILHVEGDEEMTPGLQNSIDNLNRMTNGLAGDIYNLELDFFPADNHAVLKF